MAEPPAEDQIFCVRRVVGTAETGLRLPVSPSVDESEHPVRVDASPVLTIQALKAAGTVSPSPGREGDKSLFKIILNQKGAAAWKAFGAAHAGERVAFIFDGKVYLVARVVDTVDEITIPLRATKREVDRIAALFREHGVNPLKQ